MTGTMVVYPESRCAAGAGDLPDGWAPVCPSFRLPENTCAVSDIGPALSSASGRPLSLSVRAAASSTAADLDLAEDGVGYSIWGLIPRLEVR